MAAFDRLQRIAAAGGDHADVDGDVARAADARQRKAVPEHAQQEYLQTHRHLGDLVEEQRASLGLPEEARMDCSAPGESPVLVTEQLPLMRSWAIAPQLTAFTKRAAATAEVVHGTRRVSLPVPLSP